MIQNLETTKTVPLEIVTSFPMMWVYCDNEDNFNTIQEYVVDNRELLLSLFELFNYNLESDISKLLEICKESTISLAFIHFFSQHITDTSSSLIDTIRDSDIYVCRTGKHNIVTDDDKLYQFPIGKLSTPEIMISTSFDSTRLVYQYNNIFPINIVRVKEKEDVVKLASPFIYKSLTQNKTLYLDFDVKTFNDFFLNRTSN